MLSLETNHTGMSLLEFMTHVRIAVNLINAVPIGYSLNALDCEDLKIISPSSFLFPLASMNRPILSPIQLDQSNETYFDRMQSSYNQLIETFSTAIVPYLLKKEHKMKEDIEGEPLRVGDIIMFKKKTKQHIPTRVVAGPCAPTPSIKGWSNPNHHH